MHTSRLPGTQTAVEQAVQSVQAAVTAINPNGAGGKSKRKGKGKAAATLQAAAAAPPAGRDFGSVAALVFAATSGAGRGSRRALTKVLVTTAALAPAAAAQYVK